MKNLLLALFASILLISCTGSITTNNDKDTILSIGKIYKTPVFYKKLKKGDTFYFGYCEQMVDKFTVIDTNKGGVFVNDMGYMRYFPYHDLYGKPTFKLLTK